MTGSFDREPSNSVEQTFTVVVVGFMIAPEKNGRSEKMAAWFFGLFCFFRPTGLGKFLAAREEQVGDVRRIGSRFPAFTHWSCLGSKSGTQKIRNRRRLAERWGQKNAQDLAAGNLSAPIFLPNGLNLSPCFPDWFGEFPGQAEGVYDPDRY